MPQLAGDVGKESYLRALILGGPKVGKSTTVVSTSPGPAYVINCDGSKTALQGAARRRNDFEWDLVRSWDEMQVAVKNAKAGVQAGKYKTVILDTLSSFAAGLEEQCLASSNTGGGPDGRRAYPDYERRLRHVVGSLFQLPAHIIAISHYLQLGGEVEGSTAKYGDGIVPLLAGKARATIPMLFHDVLFMTLHRGERIFVCNPQGSWGPGSRSLETSESIPASIEGFLDAISKSNKGVGNGSAGNHSKAGGQVGSLQRGRKEEARNVRQ